MFDRVCQQITDAINDLIVTCSEKGETKSLYRRLNNLRERIQQRLIQIEYNQISDTVFWGELAQIAAHWRDLAAKYPDRFVNDSSILAVLNQRQVYAPIRAKITIQLLLDMILDGRVSTEVVNKFLAALSNGYARGVRNANGIKILKSEVNQMTHELKIKGSAARLLGQEINGIIVFSKYSARGLH